MVELDRNVRGVDVLPIFLRADFEPSQDQQADNNDPVTIGEKLIVATGALFSIAIVALGVWKLVELIV